MTLTASTSCLRILTSTPYLTFESLSAVIGTLGTEAKIADSLQAASNEGSTVLVITSKPTYVLAEYLQSALDMRSALAQWIEWSEGLLLYQRKNRRNIMLVDLELLTKGDAADFDRLKSRLDIDFSRLPVSFTAPLPKSELLLLATVGISADYRATTLAQELEAAMFCPAEDGNLIELTERALENIRNNSRELSLQRETMALQLSEMERQARLLSIEEQKALKASEALSRENALASQLRKAQNYIESLSTKKQKHLTEFSRILAQVLHKRDLMRWPWVSRRAWQIRVIRDCGIVDPEWYLQHHQDVANAGAEPFRHYIDYGVKEGRPPNKEFL